MRPAKARRIVLRASGLDPLAVYVVAKQRFHVRLLPFALRERRTRFALDPDVLLAGFPNRRFIGRWFPGCLVEKMWSRAKKVNQRFF